MAGRADAQTEHYASVRETVESLWVAIVLAFVLRAFVLEAFMIPTGSMAPRLMGEHRRFECPACGHYFAYGGNPQQKPSCPSCRHTFALDGGPSDGGDRVLVLKYLYRFRQPRPWDVMVFRNPQNNEENYIKRLIGLPGQQVEILHGDIYVRHGRDANSDGIIDQKDFDALGEQEAPWQILRKNPKTQQVMWQVIFDNDYQPDLAVWSGPRPAWTAPWTAGDGWSLEQADNGRTFRFAGKGASPAAPPGEVRFTNDKSRFYPYYAYNGAATGDPRDDRWDEFADIIYDLNLSFLMAPEAADSRVGLHLSSFNEHFIGWVGADGACRLEHGLAGADGKIVWDKDAPEPRKDYGSNTVPAMQVGRAYQVAMTHVDHRVTLWVDGRAVIATQAQYQPDRQAIRRAVREAQSEGTPLPLPVVAVLGEGGPCRLRHVRLMRDVYYTESNLRGGRPGHGSTGNPITLRRFLSQPDLDEFYVLGDNSPASKDSRLWEDAAETLRDGYVMGTVPRYNIIGKAFFVYWPGGYRLPILDQLPIVPNVGKMRLIR